MGSTTFIASELLAAIADTAACARPLEACGLLFGEPSHVTGWSVCRNVAVVPERRFEIEPAALFAALRAERTGGARLAGYWHSHPSGDARPSDTDIASAAPDDRLWLIVAGEERSLWRATAAGFAPVTLLTDALAAPTPLRQGSAR